MRKRSGFTLIELLAVIAVIGIISLIAIPNIVGLSSGVKKDQMLDDAKKLISLAKYKVNTDYEIRNLSKESICNGTSCTLSLEFLNFNGDIENDPDGGVYSSQSKVTYSITDNVATYCVSLIGSRRTIGKDSCINEGDLYGRSIVVDLAS